jgi:hypothetical protein
LIRTAHIFWCSWNDAAEHCDGVDLPSTLLPAAMEIHIELLPTNSFVCPCSVLLREVNSMAPSTKMGLDLDPKHWQYQYK